MFDDKAETSDRTFITLLIAAVFFVLLGIRFYANHLQERKKEAAATQSEQQPRRVLQLEAITEVYECERDGQRVLTDRPCGTGVPIRVIAKPQHGSGEPSK